MLGSRRSGVEERLDGGTPLGALGVYSTHESPTRDSRETSNDR